MPALQPYLYKGFELYPLVFLRAFKRFDGHPRSAEGYDVAVRVCRVGVLAPVGTGRVFRLEQSDAFTEFGAARRAARQRGEDIIDGKVEGASVVDL
ncbi:MAG: hypothetical protein QOI13_2355 [Paraburkholderia sp.]|jgi:hypothetical protein|nr:hypothetical protein [Paraburkholderia sp.]MEA3121738.1 hypothetical protein [Paraburkholderia sp.]